MFLGFDANSVSQAVMEHSALKEDHSLMAKCVDHPEQPETSINPECVRASMEAMFMDKYTATVTYNEKVQHWRGLRGHAVTHYFYLFTRWTVRGSKPDGAILSAPLQTGPGNHSASSTRGTGSLSRSEAAGGVALTTYPHLALRLTL
jgi:hypothetical protein